MLQIWVDAPTTSTMASHLQSLACPPELDIWREKIINEVDSTFLVIEMLIKRREAHAQIGSLKSANENAGHYTTQRKSDVAWSQVSNFANLVYSGAEYPLEEIIVT